VTLNAIFSVFSSIDFGHTCTYPSLKCPNLEGTHFEASFDNKVEASYHDNDLIMTLKVVDGESEVARNFTWAVLGMEDGNFDIGEVSLDGTPNF